MNKASEIGPLIDSNQEGGGSHELNPGGRCSCEFPDDGLRSRRDEKPSFKPPEVHQADEVKTRRRNSEMISSKAPVNTSSRVGSTVDRVRVN